MSVRWVCMALVIGGCWSTEPTIDGVFTPAQWTKLQQELAPPALPGPCDGVAVPADRCLPAAELGQLLFFDPRLSSGPQPVSCASCHDPAHGFVDARRPDGVSIAASGQALPRNAPTILNVALKDALAPADDPDGDMHDVFTWSGGKRAKCPGGAVTEAQHPEEVVAIAALGGPMTGTRHGIATRIRRDPAEGRLYGTAFGASPSSQDDATVFANAAIAIGAYMRRLNALDAPFDRYLAGDDGAISDSAKRGFALFVGRGTCISCHSGPLFTDFRFHDTGVPQVDEVHFPTDAGRETFTCDPADLGKMLTPSLRNIALTPPYMHDGDARTLTDAVAFYNGGGSDAGYTGTRDPRIQPLDLTEDDVADLVAFLESLTGQLADTGLPAIRCDMGTCAH